jgi:uncharacterized protein (DUF58 family)
MTDPLIQRAVSNNPQSAIRVPKSGHGIHVSLPELIALRGEAGRLDLAPRGKGLATRSGGHFSRFRGRGMEFDESRVYQAGDDVRNMDWRVTARAGTPHVKLFREERERPVWLLVDLGPGMRFGTRVAFKSVVAARAAALLAWAAADRSDRVGGLVFDEARRFERHPAARTRGLLPLLNALAELSAAGAARPSSVHRPPSQIRNLTSPRPLAEAARRLVRLVRPGSLIFALSDFAGIAPEDSAWLAQLADANEVVLIEVYDPIEPSAPPPGVYPVTDGIRRGVIDTSAASRRRTWERRFSARAALLEDLARRHRIHRLALRTDEPVGPALARGLHPRRRRPA